ncbi:SDR family NAD(P)-dependent oxidoreductase [Burkholderia sp. Bp9142]|uniref:SDR family NAD(P)-dependent oxidoreductase n=1 Tax=Burkholderia sp. Bp9142 TaxID=2184573 RepID=UPI000F5AB0D2|nr:SDR family oxidoreductase [Burkholderia sp. Bp9142]RQR24616.1 SDR family NAD(P)-dependent oxidoreductase [Burkholderia sp. Bp9142]
MRVLEGKVALVTGGAQGIGAAFGLALARAGAAVVLADIVDASHAIEDINAAGGNGMAVTLDVCDAGSIAEAIEQVSAAFGRLDILVNNAGIASALTAKAFTEIDDDEWDRVLHVNLRGVFSCMKAAVPLMRKGGGGAIVNIASATALKGTPGYMHYLASKGGVIAITRGAARELGQDQIRVNAIAPGLIMTDNLRDHASYRGEVLDAIISARSLKREAAPEDVAGTLLYLVSPQSAFVTGQTIVVDGGVVMN